MNLQDATEAVTTVMIVCVIVVNSSTRSGSFFPALALRVITPSFAFSNAGGLRFLLVGRVLSCGVYFRSKVGRSKLWSVSGVSIRKIGDFLSYQGWIFSTGNYGGEAVGSRERNRCTSTVKLNARNYGNDGKYRAACLAYRLPASTNTAAFAAIPLTSHKLAPTTSRPVVVSSPFPLFYSTAPCPASPLLLFSLARPRFKPVSPASLSSDRNPTSNGQAKSDAVPALPHRDNMSWLHAVRLPSRTPLFSPDILVHPESHS